MENKSRRYTQNFRESWLKDPRYENWLMRVEGDSLKCTCKYCRCVFSAKLSDIERHRNTRKHEKAEKYHNPDSQIVSEDDKTGPKKDGSELVEKLIALVQAHPEIYDKNHHKHYNKHFVNDVWKSIAEELGIEDTKAKSKWCNLRSIYCREKRKTTNLPPEESTWPLFSSFKFLEDFIDHPKQSARNQNSRKRLIEQCFEDLATIAEAQPMVETELSVQQSPQKIRHEDTDFLFLCSLLPTIKKLGIIENLEFKEEVIQLLKRKLNSQSNSICYSSNNYSEHPVVAQNHASDPASDTLIIYSH